MKQLVPTAAFIIFLGSFFVLLIAPATVQLPQTEIGTFSFLAEEVDKPVPQSVSLLIAGDVMLARDVENKTNVLAQHYPFLEMTDVLQAHDYVLINFEGSIPKTHVPTPSMTMRFSVQEKAVSDFALLGITHATLANNHSFDYGQEGYEHTAEVFGKAGVQSFAHPYSVSTSSVTFVETQQKRIAFIGIDFVLSKPTDDELLETFLYATRESDEQYVIVHWGDEYKRTHNSVQENYARKFIELGADLIVGHHPHVVQDIQKINDVLVFYSLGNFVFDQYFSKDVQEGLLLSFDIGTSSSITLLPITSIGSKTQPRLMPLFERSEFLKELAKVSDETLKTFILQGKLDF